MSLRYYKLHRLRACLHGVTFLNSFFKEQKIAPLYMQSLVPRAIAIIEFGARETTARSLSSNNHNGGQVIFPIPEQFQGQNLRENPPPCIGVFLYTLLIDRPRSPRRSNSHLVLNSVMYFRSISTASNVHDHFLSLFVADSDAKDAFLFPACDFFYFSEGKPSSTSF